jgi:hypothetical protein
VEHDLPPWIAMPPCDRHTVAGLPPQQVRHVTHPTGPPAAAWTRYGAILRCCTRSISLLRTMRPSARSTTPTIPSPRRPPELDWFWRGSGPPARTGRLVGQQQPRRLASTTASPGAGGGETQAFDNRADGRCGPQAAFPAFSPRFSQGVRRCHVDGPRLGLADV